MAISILSQELESSVKACNRGMHKSPSAACLASNTLLQATISSSYGRSPPKYFTANREQLRLALKSVNSHLHTEESVTECYGGQGQTVQSKQLKARWVYCTNPQELTALKALLPDITVEYLFLGVTVHLDSIKHDPDMAAAVADDVAGTFAALELVLEELAKQSKLRCLRLDINVLVPNAEPFELPACRFLNPSHAPVMASVDRLTNALKALLDENTSIKNLKLGLHPKLYSMLDRDALSIRRPAMLERRLALIMAKHDRLGARSEIADVPYDVLTTILDAALPLDQTVHVVALRK